MMYLFLSENRFDGFEIIHLAQSFEQALANQAQFPYIIVYLNFM